MINVVGSLNKGAKVRVDKNFSDGWSSIYFGSHGGFVATRYLQ